MKELKRKQLSELMEENRAKLMAMDKDLLVIVRVSRERAWELTNIILDSIKEQSDEIEESFSTSGVAKLKIFIEEVFINVQVFYIADLLCDVSQKEENERRKELAKKVREHDRTLCEWAWPLFKAVERLKIKLTKISKGRGLRVYADSTTRLVDLFMDNWDYAEGKTPIKLEYLNEAARDATEFISLLAEPKESVNSSREFRSRAYTAWYLIYIEIMYAGRYILRHHPDVIKIFPGVNPKKKKPAKKLKPNGKK